MLHGFELGTSTTFVSAELSTAIEEANVAPASGPGKSDTATENGNGNGPVRRSLDVNPGGSTAGSSSSIVSPTHNVAPAPKKL